MVTEEPEGPPCYGLAMLRLAFSGGVLVGVLMTLLIAAIEIRASR